MADEREFWHQYILLAIEDEGGEFSREAGNVLYDLSFITGIPYPKLSRYLLELERGGSIEIERVVQPQARQANRLLTVRMVKNGNEPVVPEQG